MRRYATQTDLSEIDDLPDNVDPYIGQASILVATAVRADRYSVDPAGMPDEPEVIEALRDATVAQVAYWVAEKVNPAGGLASQSPVVSSQSAEGGSVSYSVTQTAETITASLSSLCPSALAILRLAGLGSGVPQVW